MDMKKIVIAAVALALCLLPMVVAMAEKADVFFDEEVLEDGTVMITDCTIISRALDEEPISLTIPSTLRGRRVTGIGEEAFAFCYDVIGIIIPDSVTRIEGNPFADCWKLETITVAAGNPVLRVIDGVLYNMAENRLICCPGMGNINSCSIPQGIETIGINAFYDCGRLKALSIPGSVRVIEGNPFEGCYALEEIYVSTKNSSLGTADGALYDKADGRLICYPPASEASVCDIPAGIESIETHAFNQCANLTDVTIPEGVMRIGHSAFWKCEGLTKVKLPASLVQVEDNPFIWCSGLEEFSVSPQNPVLESVSGVLFNRNDKRLVAYPPGRPEQEYAIPDGTRSVGSNAFYNCVNLSSVHIPDSLNVIGESAFMKCGGLENVTIPQSVTDMGAYAFSYCDGLTDVTVPGSMRSIGSFAFFKCANLAGVEIQAGVEAIGNCAFEDCDRLTRVAIPDSVKDIGNFAFERCWSLKSLAIPENVTHMGNHVFWMCASDLVVTVATGSYAEDYCRREDIKCVNP